MPRTPGISAPSGVWVTDWRAENGADHSYPHFCTFNYFVIFPVNYWLHLRFIRLYHLELLLFLFSPKTPGAAEGAEYAARPASPRGHAPAHFRILRGGAIHSGEPAAEGDPPPPGIGGAVPGGQAGSGPVSGGHFPPASHTTDRHEPDRRHAPGTGTVRAAAAGAEPGIADLAQPHRLAGGDTAEAEQAGCRDCGAAPGAGSRPGADRPGRRSPIHPPGAPGAAIGGFLLIGIPHR